MKRVILFISGVLMVVFSGCMSQPNPYEKKFIDDAYYQKDYNAFVSYYKKHKKDIDINKKVEGRTALARAVKANDVKKTIFLLKNGANPNEKVEYNEKMIPLVLYAIKKRSYDVIPYLIKYGAKYDEKDIPKKLKPFVNNLDLYIYIVNHIGFKKNAQLIFNIKSYVGEHIQKKDFIDVINIIEALKAEDFNKLKKYQNSYYFNKIVKNYFENKFDLETSMRFDGNNFLFNSSETPWTDYQYTFKYKCKNKMLQIIKNLDFYKNLYFITNDSKIKRYALIVLIRHNGYKQIKEINNKVNLTNQVDLLAFAKNVDFAKKLVGLGIKPDIAKYNEQKKNIIRLIKYYAGFKKNFYGHIMEVKTRTEWVYDGSPRKRTIYDIECYNTDNCKTFTYIAKFLGNILGYHPELLSYLDEGGYSTNRLMMTFFDDWGGAWEECRYDVIKALVDGGIDYLYDNKRLLKDLSYLRNKLYKLKVHGMYGEIIYPCRKTANQINEIIYKLENQNPVVYFAEHNNLYLVKKYRNYLNKDVAEKVFNIAIKNNNLDMVKFLISSGYSPTLEVFKLSLNVNPKICGMLYSKLNNKSQALKIAMQNSSVFSEIVKQSNKIISCDIIEKAAMDKNRQIISIISKHAQNKVKQCIDNKLKKAYNEIKSISEYHEGAIDLAKAQKMANAYKIDIKEKIAKVEKLKKALYPKYQKYVEELMARQKKEYEERKRARSRYVSVSIRDCYNKTCSVDVNGNYSGTIAYWWKSSSGGYYVINYKATNGGLLGKSGHYHPSLNEVYMSDCGTKRRVYSLKQAMKYVVKCAVSGHY